MLMSAIDKSGFADLREHYVTLRSADGTESGPVFDVPTTIVTVTRAGRTKRVQENVSAPDALKQLEQRIDEIAQTKRVIRIDAATVKGLAHGGWKLSADDGAELLRRALMYDDVDAIRALLAAGVDANAVFHGSSTTPLMLARSRDAAKALVAAGANPLFATHNGYTALTQATYVAPEVTQVLLSAGARADQPVDDGRTPLYMAACAGNIGVVKLLLAAGADPRVRSGVVSAPDCARRARDNLRQYDPASFGKPPFAQDFDAVIAALEQAAARRRR